MKHKAAPVDYIGGKAYAAYPIDLGAFQLVDLHSRQTEGVSYRASAGYHPTTSAQHALVQWNAYLATGNDSYAQAFLQQVYCLVEHEMRIDENAGGWPLAFPASEEPVRGSWLSALTQGLGLSALVRAYQLTHDHTFLEVMRRVVRTFECDILDGGVCAPFEQDGLCFEGIAVYPATHDLSGFIFGLCGLYDYRTLFDDSSIEQRMQAGLATLHDLLEEFEAGFWTFRNLLERRLASPTQLTLHAQLLDALAALSSCKHCSELARRWKEYRHRLDSRMRYWLASQWSAVGQPVRRWFQHRPMPLSPLHVCVAVPAFPAPGGIQTFIEKIVQVTRNDWQIEYLTQHRGPDGAAYRIRCFGTRRMTPWYFPFIWLYVISGFRKLVSLVLHGAGYHVVLAQDGVFTGAFTALAARLTGMRVVCIDHGDLSLLIARNRQRYRSERLREIMTRPWPMPIRLTARLLLSVYWPSRWLLARIAARFVDHYLIPGVPQDGVNEICKQLGIPRSRVTRFANMIDIRQFTMPDAATRAELRRRLDIAPDAVVVAIVCRLAAEKGLEIALEALQQALAACAATDLEMRVIIVGDGPLRGQVEQHISQYELDKICCMQGELPMREVIAMLSISDIFLYTSWRGAGYPLAIMEAMAAGCAVIASTEPIANACLLDEGRGITVPPGDVPQTARALGRLLQDRELCQTMGRRARAYITQHHSPIMFQRTLLRATYWSALDSLLSPEKSLQVNDECTVE
ncbi:MAG TPA: D-glucuronyl C5-epimerase family protein [Ktedonobacteraceae bacterium]|nr:D-glucuronyl C5-epimerase family protein [Ktedonobacteraceae bacterium]